MQSNDAWVAIDPNGAIGDSAYEVAAFIRNPMPELLNQDDVISIIDHLISRFAEILELPSQRIIDWCFVQAVLAWVWAIEDGCDDSCFKSLTVLFGKYTGA